MFIAIDRFNAKRTIDLVALRRRHDVCDAHGLAFVHSGRISTVSHLAFASVVPTGVRREGSSSTHRAARTNRCPALCRRVVMRNSRASLAEVARSTGFADPRHLARVFRRNTGIQAPTAQTMNPSSWIVGSREIQSECPQSIRNGLAIVNGGSDGTRTRGLLRDRQAFSPAELRPRIHCSAFAGLFPSVPTAAQLCPKLPESAVTVTISLVTNRKHAARMAPQKRFSKVRKQFVDC